MKPVVLSMAAAVLLLITLACYRLNCQPDTFDSQIVHKPTQTMTLPEKAESSSESFQSASEPVNLSGKSVNFFVSF